MIDTELSGDMLTAFGQYRANIWTIFELIFGQYSNLYLDNISMILGKYFDNIWTIFGLYMDNI